MRGAARKRRIRAELIGAPAAAFDLWIERLDQLMQLPPRRHLVCMAN
jgi:hypothetical protein